MKILLFLMISFLVSAGAGCSYGEFENHRDGVLRKENVYYWQTDNKTAAKR